MNYALFVTAASHKSNGRCTMSYVLKEKNPTGDFFRTVIATAHETGVNTKEHSQYIALEQGLKATTKLGLGENDSLEMIVDSATVVNQLLGNEEADDPKVAMHRERVRKLSGPVGTLEIRQGTDRQGTYLALQLLDKVNRRR